MEQDEIKVSIRVAQDGMSVSVDASCKESQLMGLLTAMQDKLVALGLPNVPPPEDLTERMPAPAEGRYQLSQHIIMSGRAPVAPVDGRLEWSQDFFTEKYATDASGTLDYHQREEPLTVEVDQLLVKIYLPVEGSPGVDVYGRESKLAQPKVETIAPGNNIRKEDEDDGVVALYSMVVGRLQLNGKQLAVDEVYRAQGNVDFETGDINHPGPVSIAGDVFAGFKVEAEGDIEVRGIVEAAEIKAGGNLKVHAGIAGSEDRKIVVAGNLEASFIENTDVEVGGDVTIRGEILNSHVKCRGSVIIPSGRILNSTVVALEGIEVGQAGSSGAMPVLLVVGEDFEHSEELAAKRTELTNLEAESKELHDRIDPLAEKADSLPPKRRKAYDGSLLQMEITDNAVKELIAAIEEIEGDTSDPARERIIVRRKVFGEVTLRIRSVTRLIIDEKNGPVAAIVGENGIEFGPV